MTLKGRCTDDQLLYAKELSIIKHGGSVKQTTERCHTVTMVANKRKIKLKIASSDELWRAGTQTQLVGMHIKSAAAEHWELLRKLKQSHAVDR